MKTLYFMMSQDKLSVTSNAAPTDGHTSTPVNSTKNLQKIWVRNNGVTAINTLGCCYQKVYK